MSAHCYYLDGKNPVAAASVNDPKFIAMYEGFDPRRVAWDEIGEYRVSTVFLCFDHAFGGGPPVLFETMIFGNKHGGEFQWRYETWDQAVAGHNSIVDKLKSGKTPEEIEQELS
jgi:hypothetical protein